ncbi:ybbR-like family protein, partial [Vibrio parahaemolyticus 12310]
KCSASACRAL